MTDEQQLQRERDQEVIKHIDQYYNPYREQWRRNGPLFNLLQYGSNDVTSNWYLGWGRILCNHFLAMLSAGNPKGDFDPVGNQDPKMRILVNALVEHMVEKCHWSSHQRLWLQDLVRDGNGVIEAYSELPMRKRRYERNGKTIERFVRDFRRAKVGLRRRSYFRCMRSHFISDPDDVPVSIKIEEGTWNQFALRYGMAVLPDGTKKYDTDQIPVGSHYRCIHFYDENEDAYRIYCMTYGGKPEAKLENSCPPVAEIGFPIYDKPLSRYKILDQGRQLAGGANIPGMSPLAFATFEDQLDSDSETYSTVGMGIFQAIEGLEAIMQGLVNMSIDNERLKSTVPISYEPLSADSPSALDLDVRTMYSGLVVDGKITPQPLGQSSAGSNQVLWEWLKFLIYQLTGINPEPLTGDQLNTAYQSGLLMQQMSLRAKAKIKAWQAGPLNRAWTVLGANALSEVTVKEYEEITLDDAKRIQEAIKSDKMTAEDFDETERDEEGNTVYKKRIHTFIPVKGYKFREDFSGKNKTRTLDGTMGNTLIEDPKMPGNTSYVVADEKYLLPDGSIESIMEYKVSVDASGMHQDLKLQDSETGKTIIANAQAVAALDPSQEFLKKLDTTKLFMESISHTDKTEEEIFKTQTEQSKTHKAFAEAAEDLEEQLANPPPPNVQGVPPQQASPAGMAGQGTTGQPEDPGALPDASPALRRLTP